MLRFLYSSVSLVRYHTHTRYRPPVESASQSPSSDSIMIEDAPESFSLVKFDAFLPHSSILPVDSGVLIARYLALNTPPGMTDSGTLKCVVSPSTKVFTETVCFSVSEFISSLTDAA